MFSLKGLVGVLVTAAVLTVPIYYYWSYLTRGMRPSSSTLRLNQLEKEGIPLEKFASVHAPVGLDIGALTPEEIAISITAELIAIRRGAHNIPHKSVKLENAVTAPVHSERSS